MPSCGAQPDHPETGATALSDLPTPGRRSDIPMASWKDQLNVLCLEDNAADRERIADILHRDGLSCHFVYAATKQEFEAGLKNRDLDLILADFTLPGYCGMAALEVARERRPSVPFIFVSATLGEEYAIETLKSGADDYVLKDHLDRLAPAVWRALREAESRRARIWAEEELRQTHEKLRYLLEHSPVVMYTFRIGAGQVSPLIVSGSVERVLGVTAAELAQQAWWRKGLRPDEREQVNAANFDGIEVGSHSAEYPIRQRDGTYVWVEDNYRVLGDVNGRPCEVVGVWADITERKRLESELALREQRMNAFFSCATVGLVVLDENLRYVQINETLADMNGIPAEAHIGNTLREITPRFAPVLEPIFRKVLETGQPVLNVEISGETPRSPGIERHWMESFFPIQGPDGRPQGVGAIVVEVTDLKRAERALRTSEQRFRDISEAAGEFIWETDAQGRFTYASERVQAVLGYDAEEILGRSFFELVDPAEVSQAEEFWNGHVQTKTGFRDFEVAVISKTADTVRLSGTAVPIIGAAGEFLGFRGASLDVTEKRRLESKFLRAQRLESIGSLASGIAHDLNNILTPILMGTSFLHSDLAGTPHEQLLATIESSAERAVDVVKQLLAIGRGQVARKSTLQIRHLVRDMAKIARETFPRSIQVEEETPPNLWPIQGDHTQIHQVLLNLCVNARDAMPQGGCLTLKAENVVLDDHYVSMHREASPGPFVRLVVKDTGVGIPEPIRGHIFDPFFTTKDPSAGTGLGLTTVLGIVKDHHGFIHLTTEPGQGTCFEIHVPATPDAKSLTETEQARRLPPPGNSELILVVDDEPAIREAVQRTLEHHGYTVLVAGDGIEALVQHAANVQSLRLVLTDILMPVMDGTTLCRTLHRVSPRIPIIAFTGALTGESGREILRALDESGVLRVLHKPHGADELLLAVHEALKL